MNIFNLIWIFWLLSEFVLNLKHRSKISGAKQSDKNSLSVIWVTISLAVSASVFAAFFIHVPILRNQVLKYTGLALIVAGVIIRLVAIRTLGRFFTVNLSIDTEHKLIDTGLYKYIRHPSYSGSLLSFAGLALHFNNWVCLFVILIPVVSVFIYRIRLEEQLLLQQPGLNYSEYINRTKRLIPFVY